MNGRARCAVVIAAVALLLFTPTIAFAYGGPGSVISGVGALLAALAAISAAVFGFLWFPAKRLFSKVKRSRETEESTPGSETSSG